jgi:catechol 2,3-dioxygenase-like lactoylglutathione lyase family enzyme
MFAKLKHIAVITDQYTLQGTFYRELFGMSGAAKRQSESRALTVSDGYVGLNFNPRKAGRHAGLDHFGLDVEDIERVRARLSDKYPAIEVLQRPTTRPFASFTTHDPAGNVFDISQQGLENRASVYAEEGAAQSNQPVISHFALRTMNVDVVAKFFQDVYELEPLPKKSGDRNYYLSDGRVTLMLMPWSILDFRDTGIPLPGPDHIGFKVDNIEAFKEQVQTLGEINPNLRAMPVGVGSEGRARLKLLAGCQYGSYHLADVDGILIDVSEK